MLHCNIITSMNPAICSVHSYRCATSIMFIPNCLPVKLNKDEAYLSKWLINHEWLLFTNYQQETWSWISRTHIVLFLFCHRFSDCSQHDSPTNTDLQKFRTLTFICNHRNLQKIQTDNIYLVNNSLFSSHVISTSSYLSFKFDFIFTEVDKLKYS